MFSSLRFRLIFTSTVSLVVLVSGVSVVLERAFYQSLSSQLEQRMQTQFFMILTAADEEAPGQLYLPEVVREGVYNQIDSGHYAFVISGNGNEVWRSFSAVDLDITFTQTTEAGEFLFDHVTLNNAEYFRLRYTVIWESVNDTEHQYTFILLHDAGLLYVVTNEFRLALWTGLGFVLGGMLLVQVLALKWGLSPLGLIANDLEKIETGQQKTLSDDYPKELKPLTRNLNLLIEAERSQRERYRETLSNLAHSLKTPLAVMKGTVDQKANESGQVMLSQIDRMDEIIQYQLHRAVAGQQGHMLASVNVKICLDKILGALSKVYQHKSISFSTECTDNVRFFGDEGDFMEIMGNLLDNACKWTDDKVDVAVTYRAKNESHHLHLCISDNGPGVPLEKRESILKRGQRLDEMTEGQGIGLSVVAELVHQYGGSITVSESSWGGAQFDLQFEFLKS